MNQSAVSMEGQLSAVREQCKSGKFLDAYKLAQSYWGEMSSWSAPEQKLLAIRFLANLGGDRRSDALLLKSWRKDKESPELLERVLYYKLNKYGAILCSEFLEENQAYFDKSENLQADLLGFKSIIRRIYEDFSGAEKLISAAEQLSKDESWLQLLRVNVLSAQNEHQQANGEAEKLYRNDVSLSNLRAYAKTLLETQGASQAINLYEKHLDEFQSVPMLFEYGYLLVTHHEWQRLESLLPKIFNLKQFNDKHDERTLASWQGQLAIQKDNMPEAIEYLSKLDSGYWQIAVKNLKHNIAASGKNTLAVPFIRQKHMTCAPTTIAAISQYWGRHFSEDAIADEICYDGTADHKERQWLRDNDFVYQEFELESELAYTLIERGVPFALVTSNGFSAHMQAVIGCNRRQGTMYIMDPSNSIMQELLIEETIQCEASSGARCLAFVPEQKAELLAGLNFPASELYRVWDEYTVASQKNDHNLAQKAIDKLIAMAPDHRICLRAQRSFAVWKSDISQILHCNKRLLEKFPDEAALVSSSYYCYRDMGQREKGLALLDEYVTRYFNLDMTGILFGEIYDTNSHLQIAESCLADLKRYGSSSANAHSLIANDLWNKSAHSLATKHYFIAHCLEPTTESYIVSYFKAARYIGEADLALKILIERYEKYKLRSPLPAISLFRALEILGKEHLGLEYLQDALKLHHKDSELVVFLAEKLIENGQFDKLEPLKPIMQRTLDHDRYQFLLATAHEKQGHYELATKIFHALFEKYPYLNKYGDAFFRVLRARGEDKKINKCLESLYDKDPNNTIVLDLISDWHSDPRYLEKVLEHFAKIRPDHGVVRRHLIDVRLRLGKLEEALHEAKQCCDHLPGQLANRSYLAYCHLKLGNYKDAAEISRNVLSQNVDDGKAFDVLMEASLKAEDKKEALSYVISQIKGQIVTSDAPWGLWYAGKSLLDKSVLEDFSDYLLKELGHHWYSYSLKSSYYIQYSQIADAQLVLAKGIERFPLVPRLYSDLAQVYEYQGDFENALKQYQNALELNPAWSAISRKVCEIYERSNDSENATKVIRDAIKYNANDGVLYGFYADILIASGQRKEAIQALRKAVTFQANYRWAWDNLITLADETNSRHLLWEFATELAEQAPYMAICWNNLAYLSADEEEKLKYFDKAFECDVYFITSYEDKARLYVNKAEYKLALQVLENLPWGEDLPEALAVLKADILSGIGKKQAAAETLEALLTGVHGAAHLWRKLFDIHVESQDEDALLKSLDKAVTRNPYDAEILCYSAEHYYRINEDKSRAISLLEKSFQLSSNNQYITLTYVDILIAEEAYSRALDCLQNSGEIREVQYSWAREIYILCKLKEHGKALNLFNEFYARGVSEYWCLNYGFQELRSEFELDALCSPYLKEEYKLNKLQAFFFADKIIYSNENDKRISDLLSSLKSKESVLGSLLALAEFWRERRVMPSQKLVDTYVSQISNDADIIAQLSVSYMREDRYFSLLKLYESYKGEEPLSAYVHYYASYCLMMLGRADEAYKAVLEGIDCKPDFSSHNLRLWYLYFQCLNGFEIALEDVNLIDSEELLDYELYVLQTLYVSASRSGRLLDESKDELSPLLRNCQSKIQAVANHKAAIMAKRRLRGELKAAIGEVGSFRRLYLNWWLSNHF